jgi:serine/threonine-protein kinase RsbW
MILGAQEFCRQEAERWLGQPEAWHQLFFRRTEEVPGLLDRVIEGMMERDYPRKDQFSVRLALEEALVNAIKHGHGFDPSKQARLRFRVTAEVVLLEVEDEGQGFDPRSVPDPLAPENLERPSGRGLFLIRTYMTWSRYNERGNGVLMGKCRATTSH